LPVSVRKKEEFINAIIQDLFETEIPPMLIQPFVENVFVHAFDSRSEIQN
jgi:sensor histidine kinase YesM